jgi:hypothetical protein
MKLLISNLFLICILFSCKKKDTVPPSTKCYHCELYSAYGGTGPVDYKDVCTDRGDTLHFKDAQGNNMNFRCTEK